MNVNKPRALWVHGFLHSLWPVPLLLGLHLILGLSAVHRKSPTFDEGVHLAGGFSYWATKDFRINPESGNWPQRWMALPAWLAGCHYPPRDEPTWIKDDRYDFADRILYESGNDADSMIFQGRVMTSLLSVGLGAIVYFWSRQLFGASGGLISLTLYAFSPTILANGFLMTTDLAAALFFSAAMWTWWTLLHRISVLSLVLSGFSVAGLLLSKYSGVLIFPMILLLLAIRLWNGQPLLWAVGGLREINGRLKQLIVFCVVLLFQAAMIDLIIWGSYGFRYSMLNSAAGENQNLDHPLDRIPAEFGLIVPVTKYLSDRGLLPEPFLYGFAYTVAKAEIRRSSMNGQFSTHGQFGFFPYCLAVKTPVEVFVVLFLAGWGAWFWRVGSKNPDPKKERTSWFELPWTGRMYALAPVLVLLGVYWTASLASHLNIGQRHLLPTYPPMFILAGVAVCWLQSIPKPSAKPAAMKRGKVNAVEMPERTNRLILIARVLLIGGLILSALEAVWIWPDYLAYFNFLAGGPAQGYRHLVDSSLDWGQDLKELKGWLARESNEAPKGERVYLSYFGTASPKYYAIAAIDLPSFFDYESPDELEELSGGTYCISATMLEGVYLTFPGKWNQFYEHAYQQLRRGLPTHQEAPRGLSTGRHFASSADSQDMQFVQLYRQLRMARLCSFLRQREPDANVGHSILIYRLSNSDVQRALEGPPVELLPDCEPDVKKIIPIQPAK